MKYLFAFIILTGVNIASAAGLGNMFNNLLKKPVTTPQPAPNPPAQQPQPPKSPVKK
jgi:hypothetical protein